MSIAAGGVGCGGSDEPEPIPPAAALEVIGEWSSAFGSERITAETWGAATVIEYDNDQNFVVTQNPADDMFNPSKFSKIVWTEPESGAFFYCTVDFGKDTAEAARNSSNTADASDPTQGGCGTFAWTELYQPIEIAGRYHSNFGGTETISHRRFGSTLMIAFDNDDNFAITQNASDAPFNPDKFNKIVWTEPVDGRFFYCFVTFAEETAEAARSTTNTADATDPSQSGCGDFAWTALEPPIEIEGAFVSNFATEEVITSDKWDTAAIIEYNNDLNIAYTQLPEDDEFNPNKFNKIVWTEPSEDGEFFYCWVDFGLDTLEEAKASVVTWDDTDPERSGCGAFPWTKLTPQ